MKNKAKKLVYLRRISQIVFFLLFVVIISQTMNHTFLEEESTARLEEQSSVFYTRTQKSFPLLIVSGALSAAVLLAIYIMAKKNNVKIKENRKLLSLTIVTGVIFTGSVLFTVLLGKSSYFKSSNGLPAVRIPVSPVFAWIILALFFASFLTGLIILIKKLFSKKQSSTKERWILYTSLIVFFITLLLIFGINSYHPDTRFFKAGPNNVPFFSFDKFIYNLDVPSTMFIETSALIGATTSIASRVMTVGIVYIFAMLIIALIFGRAFCGWVCPFGTMHHSVSWIRQRFRKNKFPREPFRKWQRLKYIFLVVILISAVFGLSLAGFFDPFAHAPRSMTTFVFPSARSLIEEKEEIKKVNPADIEQQKQKFSPKPPDTPENIKKIPKESQGSEKTGNPYANAPTRKSIKKQQGEDNPYANAPTRKSIKKQQSEDNPYANAPTRKSIKPKQAQDAKLNPEVKKDKDVSFLRHFSMGRMMRSVFYGTFFYKEKRHYDYFVFGGIILLVLLALNFIRTRFWCRYICGLGALYGIVGKYSVMRIKQNDNCTNCKMCSKFCQGACNPDIKDDFKSAECIYCFNCLDNCNFSALDVKFGWEYPKEKEPKQTDIKKRTLLKGLGVGVGAFVLFKTNFFAKRVNPKLVRPPGALHEPDFLDLCIKCGNCMRVCPNNFLQPTLFQAGLEGMFTPYGNARKGFCSPTCTLCSRACPTGAIRRLIEKDRGFTKDGFPKMKIGTAHVNENRCITYIYQRKCLVCEEHCPTSPKAIWKRDVKVKTREGKEITIGQPVVTPERCIGCGVCQHVCPVVDEPGIVITSVGETRNPKNDFSLSSQ